MPKKSRKTKPKKTPKTPANGGNGASYTAKDIYVLEGLEPVRKRPGMYIGSTGPDGLHHLIWEVVDNSIDEAMMGYAKNIRVELLPEGHASVTDDGRGIPVETHKQTKKSALETVMCTLHAGGKFGGESYKVSGGLHGVGVSVVNALSSFMRVEVCRDGKLYAQEYSRGKPKAKVKQIGKCDQTGTKVMFEADKEVFEKIEYDRKRVLEHLRQQAYLTKGVKIELVDLRDEIPSSYAFYFEGGLLSFLRYLSDGGKKLLQAEPFYVHKTSDNIEVEATFSYSNELDTKELSFANNIYTSDGGMHLTGFRSAVTRALNNFALENTYIKDQKEAFTGDDAREGLVAVVSVKLREPQFEGQTKARLGNTEARTAVEAVVGEALKDFLERYSSDARKIIERCVLASKARLAAKAARDTVLRKGVLEGLTLPGKLADCSNSDPAMSELFIVEGDSAGGCFDGNTKVALTDGRDVSFKELVEEDKQGKQNFCYTVKKDGSIGIEKIEHPRVTRKSAEVVQAELDNGEKLICTPDHKFMMRDGSYKHAKDLTHHDSLMPLYRKHSKIGGRITIDGYEMIFNSIENRWIFTHLLADAYNLKHSVYRVSEGPHRHHKDFNKLNNNPDNLVRLTREGHLELHRRLAEKTILRPEVQEKLRELRKTPAFRNKVRTSMLKLRGMLSERAKHQWEDPVYKEYMTRKFMEFYESNGEYREKNKAILNEAQKTYWANDENRNRQSQRTTEYFITHPEDRMLLSEKAKKQWEDENLREWRSQETKEQWTPEFRMQRKAAYNATYLNRALGMLRRIYEKNGAVDVEAYNTIRKETNDKILLRYDTIVSRFFDGRPEKLVEAVAQYNHKIVSVAPLKRKVNVYDIEVPETHNFALASGIFVHNSAKMGRDRQSQAILPLKGKILNVEKARLDKMLVNKEIRALVIALGTAIAESFDVAKIRYHKIILMTDADVDGAHIRTLLLTLFYRYFQPIISTGYLYIAQPPLYRVSKGKDFKYVYREEEKEKAVKGLGEGGISIQRYKGLGEMNPEQLWETTMNPATRLLKRVTIEDAVEADKLFDVLMGEEVAPRKHFIQARALSVKNLDV